jgi:hypothetical protein
VSTFITRIDASGSAPLGGEELLLATAERIDAAVTYVYDRGGRSPS